MPCLLQRVYLALHVQRGFKILLDLELIMSHGTISHLRSPTEEWQKWGKVSQSSGVSLNTMHHITMPTEMLIHLQPTCTMAFRML